jgi:hypothetical protein
LVRTAEVWTPSDSSSKPKAEGSAQRAIWLHDAAVLVLGVLARQQRVFEAEHIDDAISVADYRDVCATVTKMIETSAKSCKASLD